MLRYRLADYKTTSAAARLVVSLTSGLVVRRSKAKPIFREFVIPQFHNSGCRPRPLSVVHAKLLLLFVVIRIVNTFHKSFSIVNFVGQSLF